VYDRHQIPHRPSARNKSSAEDPSELSKDELKDLVQLYSGELDETNGSDRVTFQAFNNIVSHNIDQAAVRKTPDEAQPERPDEPSTSGENLRHFWHLFNDQSTPHKILFKAYLVLPYPRLDRFSEKEAHIVLQRFSQVENKSEASMLRYLSLIDDMKISGLVVTRKQWNTAISFAGRCYRNVKNSDVQSAMFYWREMEKSAGVMATTTTFNILFDIAVKSSHPTMPDVILREMKARGLKMDRYTHVGMISYKGLCGDGAAVRRAYSKMVDDGQIIDTAVLNAVMSALVVAGEPQSALQILHRMHRIMAKKGKTIHMDWRRRKDLGQVLKRLTQIKRRFPVPLQFGEMRLAPDMISFSIFINYYCEEAADFEETCAMLDMMGSCGFVPDRSTYQSLFKGFVLHGNLRYSPWTLDRLEIIYKDFIDVKVKFGRDVVMWCLRAFVIKAGREKAESVWQTLSTRWSEDELEDDDLEYIRQRFYKFINDKDPD